MARTFVAINDPLHTLLRELTRETPLTLSRQNDGLPVLKYKVRLEKVPGEYYAVAAFHALGGRPLPAALGDHWPVWPGCRADILQRAGYFDALRLDRRCCRDLRLRLNPERGGLVAGELLAFGSGMVRARNDNPAEPVHRYLWQQHGRLLSRDETVLARLRALHCNSILCPAELQKESFDSTNLVYGDALGELEQLWERRADTAFFDQVARSLKGLRLGAEFSGGVHPPQNLSGLFGLHLRAQALWKRPPASGRALLRRLNYILDHTVPDTASRTLFPQEKRSTQAAKEQADWKEDPSGYDGWLDGCNPGKN